jgi:hypothetical protein
MFSFKGVKMTTAKWTINTGEQSSRIWAILLQGLMKRVVCQCVGGGNENQGEIKLPKPK